MGRVDGKVAIVTGGAGGIGSATAARLAEEGARLVIADLDGALAEEVAHRIGGDAIAVQFDASDVASTEAMIAKAADHFGRIDVLHNNAAFTAGAWSVDTTLLDTSVETWDLTMATNLRSMFVSSKAAMPHMLRQGGGSIINMAAGAAYQGMPALIAYGTSKAGVANFTRYLAVQYGRQNVRSNCILPGLILTKAVTDHVPDTSNLVPHLPFHRDGQPYDIAALVLFLSSDEAQFMNGQLLCCDGGLSAGNATPREK
jgi:NAD(P)-dependent dehydrogenase (short-subunit alcohol dehydrogenase family)